MQDYFATYGRGAYIFVKNELNLLKKLVSNVEIQIPDELNVEGKICFKANIPFNLLCDLRTIERLFLSMLFIKFHNNNQSLSNKNDILKFIEENFSINDDVLDLLGTFSLVKITEKEEKIAKKECKSIKYRINVKTTGRWREINNLKDDLIERITTKMLSCNRHLEADLKEFDFELICHLSEQCLAVGLQLTKQPLSSRKYPIKHVGLRSTTCANMIQAALIDFDIIDFHGIKDFSIVCDPFCGKSTIFCEWFETSLFKPISKYFYMIGSDASNQQLEFSKENLDLYENWDLVNTSIQNSASFPYRDNCIDLIITDLPFGLNHIKQFFKSNDNKTATENFYTQILKEFGRILVKKNGYMILLVNLNEKEIFENELKKFNNIDSYNFKILIKCSLSLGKTNAILYKIYK